MDRSLVAGPSRRGPIYPDSSPSRASGPHGNKQAIEFSDEQRRARPGSSVKTGDAAEPAVFRLEDIQVTFATAHIDPVPLRIHEQVVGIPACCRARNQLAILHGKRDQRCRLPEDDQNLPGGLVQRHRKVPGRSPRRPAGHHLATVAVGDVDLARLGNIGENPVPTAFEPEAFGVAAQGDVRDFQVFCGSDDGHCSVAIAHEHPAARTVDTDIVRVFAKPDSPCRAEAFPLNKRTVPSPPSAT